MANNDPSFSQPLLTLTQQTPVNVTNTLQAIKDVQAAGTTVDAAVRSKLNFVSGATVVDNAASDRVDITITPAGSQLDYAQITASTALVTSATLTAATTGASVAYDGSRVKLEFWCPRLVVQSSTCEVCFTKDGATIDIGGVIAAAVATLLGFKMEFFDTPSAASHTYGVSIKGDGVNGTQVVAGAGGAGTNDPAFLRVTRA